jgi:ABC-type dipeptide/oligopeptide/nickel transport system ATPase subunit
MLNVQNVSVRRGKSITLHDISLSLASGRTLAVVGESGAGKSTLINAILGLVPRTSGDITWSDKPVRACHPTLVMQEPRSAFNSRLALRRSVLEPRVARGFRLSLPRANLRRVQLTFGSDLLDRLIPAQGLKLIWKIPALRHSRIHSFVLDTIEHAIRICRTTAALRCHPI